MSLWGAIILAGGASRRMGVDKARLDWDGRPAVDRLAELVALLGIEALVVAGADLGLAHVPDPDHEGGPTGGVLAGAAWLADRGCDRALVLAVDAPTLTAQDLQPLLDAPLPGAAYAGLPLPMAFALVELPQDAEPGWPLRRLVDRLQLAALPCPPGSQARIRGANTPDERAALLSRS